MQLGVNNFLNWLKSSLPLHLVFALLMLFGNNFIEADSNPIITFYLISLVTLCANEILKFSKKIEIEKVFIFLALANVFLSVLNPYTQIIESFRVLMLFLMVLSGGLAIQTFQPTINNHYKTWINKKHIPLLLFLIIAFAFALRIYGLDVLDSFRDEDHHLKSVRLLFDENCFDYKRGLIVTYTSSFFIWLSGAETYHEYLYWGRFPSVIIGSLVCIPLYYIGLKVNRLTGLTAAFLWAISPWAIGISQNLREHIYFVFLVMGIVGTLIYILDWFADDWHKHIKKIIIGSLLIAIVIGYAFFMDWFSTLKISGVLLAVVVFVYFLIHIDVLFSLLKGNKFLAPLMFLLALALFVPVTQSKFLNLVSKTDIRWSNTFFEPTAQMPLQWWTHPFADHLLVYSLFAIAAVCSLLTFKRKWWLFSLAFTIMLLGYSYFFNRFYAPRYVVFIYPIFIISFAFAFVGLIKLTSLRFSSTLKWGLLVFTCLVFILLINVKNIYSAVVQPTKLPNNAVSTTGLVHYDKQVAIDYFKKIPEDKLYNGTIITSVYDNCLPHTFKKIGWIEKYQYKDKMRFEKVKTTMQNNPYGWMVLDEQRNGNWARGYTKKEGNTFTIGNSSVKCVLNKNMCQIYEWTTNTTDEVFETLLQLDTNFVEYPEIIDIAKPFKLSFYFSSTIQITEPILSIGTTEENGIALIPNKTNNGFYVFYGDQHQIPIKSSNIIDGQSYKIELFQFGGIRGSYYGVLVNGEKIFLEKVPLHKSGVLKLFVNKKYLPFMASISVSNQVESSLLK